MRREDETGKGLPWPLHGSGTSLASSCYLLAAGEAAEGGSVGPGGRPASVHAEPGSWGAGPGDRARSLGKSALMESKLIPAAGSHVLRLLLWTVASAASGREGTVSSRWNHS